MSGRIAMFYQGELTGRTLFGRQIQLSIFSHEKKKKYSFLGRISVFLSFLKIHLK